MKRDTLLKAALALLMLASIAYFIQPAFAAPLPGGPAEAEKTGANRTAAAKPQFHVFPRTAASAVNYRFQLPDARPRSLHMMDAYGNPVKSIERPRCRGEIGLGGLQPGVYVLRATLDNGQVLQKRIVRNP